MKVILTEDVKNLGEKGELVEVSPGYARNFLIKRDMAIEATDENMARWKEEQAELEAKNAKELAEAEELKDKLSKSTVIIKGKAGEGDKLFGSITAQDIADALKEQHSIDLDRRKIDLEDNIRDLGVTRVKTRLYPGITGEIKIDVKKE